MTQRQHLHARWFAKTGEQMPEEIDALAIEQTRFAVEQVEKGNTPFVPKSVVRTVAEKSSLTEWDASESKMDVDSVGSFL